MARTHAMARLGPIAALLLAALPMALAQAGGRPGVPVYCWQATSEIKVTSEDARQVCAELWVTSPRGNPISNYWETTVLVEGLELDNNTVTNIWMIDTITPGAALWTYKMRSWDQLRPGVPYRAMSFCGSVTLNNHGFTTSKTIISSDGGHICEWSCAAPLDSAFGSGCVWGNWSDTSCGCTCNAGFCRNAETGQCTIQMVGGSCATGTGIQLDPNGQPVASNAPTAPEKTEAAAATTAAAPVTSPTTVPAAATKSATRVAASTNTPSQTSPIIVVSTSTATPEPQSRGLSSAALGGLIGGAAAVAAILVGFVLWRRVSANPAAKTLTTKKEAEKSMEEGKKDDTDKDHRTSTISATSATGRGKVAPETSASFAALVTMNRLPGANTTPAAVPTATTPPSTFTTPAPAQQVPSAPTTAASPEHARLSSPEPGVFSPLYATLPPGGFNGSQSSLYAGNADDDVFGN